MQETKQKIERHDDWRTPNSVFGPLNAAFHFTLDVAADGDNAKTCEFITAEADALSQCWSEFDGTVAWCNPPYKDITPWIEKAAIECTRGSTIVLLLPNSRDTKWYHDIIVPAKRAGYCRTYSYRGRIRFEDPHPGEQRQGPKQGNMLVVFTPPLPECWALD